MEIGIFSGSFDPVHTGHAMVANYLSQTEFDEVWMMVSRVNPLKSGTVPAPDGARLEMCRLVADKCAAVKASDFEFSLPLPSYTYVTLGNLRERWPEHHFTLIIGSDNWLVFDRWRNPEEILRDFGVLIYPRPGYPVDSSSLPPGVRLAADAPQALISSTFVRNWLHEKRNLNFFLPPEVLEYIKTHSLYE